MDYSKHSIILEKAADWKPWISLLETKATHLNVWHLMNPANPIRPELKQKPADPPITMPATMEEIQPETLTQFMAYKEIYKYLEKAYNQENRGIAEMVQFIQSTIAKKNIVYILNVGTHPWDMLVALQSRIRPLDQTFKMDLISKYQKLCAGPGTQDIEIWLDDWLSIYAEAIATRLEEFVTPERPVLDFVKSLAKRDPGWVNPLIAQLIPIAGAPLRAFLPQVIESYRHYYRMVQSLQETTKNHSAFASDGSNLQNTNDNATNQKSSSFRGDWTPSKCVCGKAHVYGDCWYFNSNLRPKGWMPQSDIMAKCEEFKREKPENQERIERSITRINEKRSRGNKPESYSGNATEKCDENQEKTTNKSPKPSVFAATMTNNTLKNTFSAAAGIADPRLFDLEGSWILDSGADVHIANKTMKNRFVKERDHFGDGILQSGNGTSEIECWGSIIINCVGTNKTVWQMHLTNVAYIPEYFTNIVSSQLTRNRKYFLIEQDLTLVYENTVYAYLQNINMKDVLEAHYTTELGYQSRMEYKSLFAIKTAPIAKWHKIMAHANHESIQQLESAAEGVNIDDIATKRAPGTAKCDDCAHAKMHRVISRSNEKEDTSDQPFHRITYDLIPMSQAMNGDEWISHFACSYYNYNMVFTHKRKGEATSIIRKALNWINNKYKTNVVYLRSDGERALGNEFADLMDEKGIKYESTAPDSPEQNGQSEKMGHIIIIKARVMLRAANLPHKLWPWATQCAGYIMNRTPSRRLQWKTPFEKVENKKPSLGHLKVYGCKAYALDKNIPKLQKMKDRAHAGYLVGYDSRNIYLIYIKSKQKVIRTRDVIFNEEEFMKGDDIDAYQIQEEPFLITTLNIQQNTNRITEIEDDEEEEDSTGEADSAGELQESREDESMNDTPSQEIPIETIESVKQESESPTSDTRNALRQLPTPSLTPGIQQEQLNIRRHYTDGEDTANHNENRSQEHQSIIELPTNIPRMEIQIPIRRSDATFDIPRILEMDQEEGTATRDINGNIDTSNIVENGSGRRLRRSAYAAKLQDAGSGSFSCFHTAFNQFTNANHHEQESRKSTNSTVGNRLHRDKMPEEPNNIKQLKGHMFEQEFRQAMKEELSALQAKGTWKEVSREEAIKNNKSAIPTRWVFKYKFNDDGHLNKFKARLCARGDLQETLTNTYAATFAARIFRALMSITTAFDYDTRQWDAVNAFANSDINESTFVIPPEGWEGQKRVLLSLQKALYGLKQSPALWQQHLSNTLTDLGLQQYTGIECLFHNRYLLLFFYVDDIAVLYKKEHTNEVDKFQEKLFNRYDMRNMGEIEWFLGIRIVRNRPSRSMWLCQDSYIDKMTSKYNISTDKKTPGSPMDTSKPLRRNTEQASNQEILLYQQRVGAINYAAVMTRPDIAFCASALSEHLTNPSMHHMDAANRCLLYLHHTKDYSIEYSANQDPQTIFIASSDASFADDSETRRSSQGYGFKLFGGMIDWKATKQKTVTTSSTEAELLSISTTGRETIWWMNFFKEINLTLPYNVKIECDNMQTIGILTNPISKFHTKLRHVDIHHHWLRQEVQAKHILIQWTNSASMIADGLTKSLPPQKHREFLSLLNLQQLDFNNVDSKSNSSLFNPTVNYSDKRKSTETKYTRSIEETEGVCVPIEALRACSSGGPEDLVLGRSVIQSAGSRAGIITEKRCSGRESELTNADRINEAPALNKLAPENLAAPAETGPDWE
jgi:hypothetical protein